MNALQVESSSEYRYTKYMYRGHLQYRSAFWIDHISRNPCWRCLNLRFRAIHVQMHLGLAASQLTRRWRRKFSPFLAPWLWLLCLCRWLLLCCLLSLSLALLLWLCRFCWLWLRFWLSGSCSCVSVAGSLALAVLSLLALAPFLDPSVWLLCLCRWLWLCCLCRWLWLCGSSTVASVAGSLVLDVLALFHQLPNRQPIKQLNHSIPFSTRTDDRSLDAASACSNEPAREIGRGEACPHESSAAHPLIRTHPQQPRPHISIPSTLIEALTRRLLAPTSLLEKWAAEKLAHMPPRMQYHTFTDPHTLSATTATHHHPDQFSEKRAVELPVTFPQE